MPVDNGVKQGREAFWGIWDKWFQGFAD